MGENGGGVAGGGILMTGGVLSVSDSTFSDNTAAGGAGGTGGFTDNGVDFNGVAGTNAAGAIMVAGGYIYNISNTLFQNNKGVGGAGSTGIALSGAGGTYTGANGGAGGAGAGAIFVTYGNTIDGTGDTFTGNAGVSGAGGAGAGGGAAGTGGGAVPDSNVPIDPPACFLAGTRVLTDVGEVPVEELTVGTRVPATSGRVARIVWLGHQRAVIPPVRVRADAFAVHVPALDILLSPDHAVFVGGVLVPVRHLINGSTIAQEPLDDVTYYHVELAAHDVILAEGLPCESYLDTGNRGAFDDGKQHDGKERRLPVNARLPDPRSAAIA